MYCEHTLVILEKHRKVCLFLAFCALTLSHEASFQLRVHLSGGTVVWICIVIFTLLQKKQYFCAANSKQQIGTVPVKPNRKVKVQHQRQSCTPGVSGASVKMIYFVTFCKKEMVPKIVVNK